jgi:hypothetical protein
VSNIDSIAKYLIAGMVILGCLILIFTGRGDPVQPWTVMGIIVGWIVRDSAGTSAVNQVERINASQPVVTASAGPPATITTQPAVNGDDAVVVEDDDGQG